MIQFHLLLLDTKKLNELPSTHHRAANQLPAEGPSRLKSGYIGRLVLTTEIKNVLRISEKQSAVALKIPSSNQQPDD